MEISAHSGARPSHASWQGQIVSLSGRRGYLSKSDIGYGTGAGFGGWNCRHDWYPFYEGVSTRNYTQSDLDKLNAKDIEYNGKMYSEYEISQMLRQKERDIRALKREKVALKTAIEEGQTFLKSDLTALNSKIREKSNQIQEFCNQTGYNRDRFREQVGGKTSVEHTTGNTQKYKDTLKNGLTFAKNSGMLNDIEKTLDIKSKYYNGKFTIFNITQERIDKIPIVPIETLSVDERIKLQQGSKELLNYMKNDTLGKEGFIAYNINMVEIGRGKSSKNNASVSIPCYDDDCIIIHNHPDGMIFSPPDLDRFVENDAIRILGAIGHNGSVYYIEKTEDFNDTQFDFDYYQIKQKYKINSIDDYNVDNVFKVVEEMLERGDNCGFKTYIVTNTGND